MKKRQNEIIQILVVHAQLPIRFREPIKIIIFQLEFSNPIKFHLKYDHLHFIGLLIFCSCADGMNFYIWNRNFLSASNGL